MYTNTEYWKSIPGNFSDVDKLIYSGAISRYGKHAKFAEVGVNYGRSFLSVLPLANFLGYIQAVAVNTFTTESDVREEFEIHLRKSIETNIIHRINDSSTEAATFFPELYFDVVFINNMHSYQSAKADIQSWLPKTQLGGVLIGYGWLVEPVREAVLEVLNPHGPQHVCENMWWYFK